MLNKSFFLFCILLIVGLPLTQATPGPATSQCEPYRHAAVVAIVGVIAVGDNEAWLGPSCQTVRSNTQIISLAGQYSGPVFLVVGTAVWTTGGFVGCTVGSLTQLTQMNAGGSAAELYTTITMTSNECHGNVILTITVSAAYTWVANWAINYEVEQPNQMYLCGPTGLTNNAFVPSGSACTNPAQVLCNANDIAATTCTDPQLNNFNFLCAATAGTPNAFNPATNTCNAVTFNVVNSGGQNIAITSWPQLQTILCGATTSPNTGVCANPTINIENTAGQTFAVTETLSGTINVVNSGSQSISVTSWPQLNALLSGRVTEYNFMCAATGSTPSAFVDSSTVCNTPTFNVVNSGSQSITLSGTVNTINSGTQHLIIDSWPTLISTVTNSGTINVVNSGGQSITLSGTVGVTGSLTVTNAGGQTITISSWPQLLDVISGNLNIHQDQACGDTIHCKVDMTCLSGTCQSMVANSTITVNQNNTSTNNLLLGVIPYNLLLVAVAFFALVAEARSDLLYWIMCLILSIILLVVRPSGSIIPIEFFIGWIFIVLYQAYVTLKNNRGILTPGEE